MDVSGARTRQKEMPVLLFLVRLLSINEGCELLSVYYIRKRCADRSYAWCSDENKVCRSQVAVMG